MKQVAELKKKQGFIEFKKQEGKSKIDDLWFMVGSRCNLTCSHCYVGSSPTNNSLEQISIKDILPYLEDGKEFGLENIYFTGGEPFINSDIINMIELSLKYGNVTVLTNATYPLTRFIPKLKLLNENSENNIIFRVSLDHFRKEIHDNIRGKGMFDITVKNVIALCKAGFKPIITATPIVYEGNNLSEEEASNKIIDLFNLEGVDVNVKILPFTLEMGANQVKKEPVFISENCMSLPGIDVKNFQCHSGRTLEKIGGNMKVYPCPIIYNNKKYEMGDNLRNSFKKVKLTHKSCFDFCYNAKGTCTN